MICLHGCHAQHVGVADLQHRSYIHSANRHIQFLVQSLGKQLNGLFA